MPQPRRKAVTGSEPDSFERRAKVTGPPAPCPTDTGKPGCRYLLKGGILLSMDASVGDFECADLLIEGERIAAIAPNIDLGGSQDTQTIDASGRILMPGFIDTHHHQFQTALRSHLADGLLLSDGAEGSPKSYAFEIIGRLAPHFSPEDVHISVLAGSLSQLDAGVTTVMDISQIHHSPEHTDAAIQGLADAGKRAALCYTNGFGEACAYPEDIRRLRRQHFASDDQLLTLFMGAEPYAADFPDHWSLARSLDIRIASHVIGHVSTAELQRSLAELLGPDNLVIHATGMPDEFWRRLADAGVGISLAVPIEMTMGHGMPPILKALEFGVPPSLSSDVECTMSADFFTQMRSLMTLQRALVSERRLCGEGSEAPLLTCREVLDYATVQGARALGLDAKTGTLTPGKQADIIALNADALNVAPLNSAPGAVVTLMERSNVETVIVAGRIRKWQGALLDVDAGRLVAELQTSRDRVFAAAGVERSLFE